MNKDNAHLYLPYVQALTDGNDIQGNPSQSDPDRWVTLDNPAFSDDPRYYRVAPDPPAVKLWVNSRTGKCAESLGFSGLPLGTNDNGHTVRLFREVL